jgi:hypothetical protein
VAFLCLGFGGRISWRTCAGQVYGAFLDDLDPQLVAHAKRRLLPKHVFVLRKDLSSDIDPRFTPFSNRSVGHIGRDNAVISDPCETKSLTVERHLKCAHGFHYDSRFAIRN